MTHANYGQKDKTHLVHAARVSQLHCRLGGEWAYHKAAEADQGHYHCISLSPAQRDLMFSQIAQAGFGVQRIPSPQADQSALVLALTEDDAARLLGTHAQQLSQKFGPTSVLDRVNTFKSAPFCSR
jgi:hypothetical protein